MVDLNINLRRAAGDDLLSGSQPTARGAQLRRPGPVGPFVPGQSLSGRRFLIVTAPFGPFGRTLAEELTDEGATVFRMVFNAGDAAYWRRSGGVTYTGDVRRWPQFLTRLVQQRGLTDIIVFGEGGPYNQGVLFQAQKLKALVGSGSRAGGHPLRTWVLENGYFRPDWITVEENGVNASSGLPRDPRSYDPPIPEMLPTRPVGRILSHHVLNISLYHAAQPLGRLIFRRYVYPYTQSPWLQFVGHVRRYFSLAFRSKRESDAQVIRARGPFFLACLQREGDAQLLRYSHYADNTAFLAEVLSSFAKNAPAETRLVIKNHPLDPGLVDLARMTHVLAVERGIADRVDFIDGGNLAALCRASSGMVVNNSSAALSALGFSTPVKVLGDAFFDIDGLTDQQPIDAFWTRPAAPDDALFKRFKAHVISRTQVNGNYHEPCAIKPTARALARRFAAAR
jgi:capsular polysaccharide export protein